MNIADRDISSENPPYIIAEVGVNHDGSVRRAVELADAAADAGADAVKLQFFKAEMLMSSASRLAGYQAQAGESDPIEMLRRVEISIEGMASVVDRAHARGIDAIVTVFSVELVAQAQRLPWDAFKTASPDVVHRPLIEAIAGTGRPMILSTGASTLDEVRRAVGWLGNAADRAAVLQCVSAYPVREEDAAYEGIGALRAEFASMPVGYSDLLTSELSGARAVVMGACMLEKHLTYDRAAKGPDHSASLDAQGLKRYITLARRAWEAARAAPDARPALFACTIDGKAYDWSDAQPRGSVNAPWSKHVLECESDVRAVSRQSVVTRRALPVGHVLLREDVTFKRPGSGLPPFALDTILGRPTVRALANDVPVSSGDVLQTAPAVSSVAP